MIKSHYKSIRLFSLLAFSILVFFPTSAQQWKVGNEVLTYNVMYKWGLINKKAGEVSLKTVGKNASEFESTLVAASASWADKFYSLRDTLKGTINNTTFLPNRYERIAHEGGNYSHDILDYDRSGTVIKANAKIWRKKKKGAMVSDTKLHQAEGITLDMLSSFYFMRQINFPEMKAGTSVKMNIFSGKKKENLTIHYQGISDVKIGNSKYPAYHITFTFTQEGGKVSSDNMDAWISTGARRIPLLMEGKLPVGKVRAVYSGSLTDL